MVPPTGAVDAGRISSLIDFQLYGPNGEVLGAASDAVLNFQTDSIDYVLVTLDTDGRLVAVPWSTISVNTSAAVQYQNSITFSGDMSRLSAASVFDANTMPELGQPAAGWDADLRSFWGLSTLDEMVQPTNTPDLLGMGAEQSTELHGVLLASDFIGLSVRAADNQSAGTVDDLVIDVETGEIHYVLFVTSSAGAEAELIAVPVQVLAWSETSSAVVLRVDRVVFIGAPFFAITAFPDTQQNDWDAALRAYWETYLVP